MSTSSNSFFEHICENYKTDLDKNLFIGYSNIRSPFIIIPTLAFIINLLIIITNLRRKYHMKKRNINIPELSIEKMLIILTYVEILISAYWLINGLFFYKVSDIEEKCVECFFTSLFYIFIQTFDWCFFTCSLHNLDVFVSDPHKEDKFKIRLNWYIIFSVITSGVYTYVVFASETYGISPMLTCFIKNNFSTDHLNQQYTIYCILAVPLIYVVYTIVKFVKVCRHNKLISESDLMKFVKNYILYALLYIIFYAPPIVLYLVTTNKVIQKGTLLGWFSFSSVWCTILFNFALCFVRIYQGHQSFSWRAFIPCFEVNEEDDENECRKSQTEILINKRHRGTIYDRLYDETVTGDFFVGLIYTLLEANKGKNIEKTLKSKHFHETNLLKLNGNVFNNSNSDFNMINETDNNVHIEVIEYAPKVFKKLRSIEGISESEIIESLNPKNNKKIIQTQGKGASFFIPTDDKMLLLKTLQVNEIETIFANFLIFYTKYLEDNPDSLICRIYGIYSVKPSTTAEPVVICVIRNSDGPFLNDLIRTYDIKGSQNKRRTNLEGRENDPNVSRRDENFVDEEGSINLIEQDRQRFLENIKKDSEFFEDLNLMDYSLLLKKINLTEELKEKIQKNDNLMKYYNRYLFYSSDRTYAYTCIIIDYFQNYNIVKKMENLGKTWMKPFSNELITCVSSDKYSERFIKFLEDKSNSSREQNVNSNNSIQNQI